VNKTSTDSIALRDSGIVYITQPLKGHRFTLDSILLADFCRIRPKDRVLEPGAGTGIISLLLAKKFPHARFVADEFDSHAYGLLSDNIKKNGLEDNIVPVDKDIKYLSRSISPNTFDAIIANPPYIKSGAGRTSPSLERHTARHDQAASLPLWLNLQALLKSKGKYFLVFPACRAVELTTLLRERKLEPKRLRFVHPHVHKPASLVLLETVKGAGAGMDVLPPLVVHEQDGGYTDEMKEIYGMQVQESVDSNPKPG
jgi:tRNA1Val (adenine37-N6)-methyltransferase